MNYILPQPIKDQLLNFCSKNLVYEHASIIINTLNQLKPEPKPEPIEAKEEKKEEPKKK